MGPATQILSPKFDVTVRRAEPEDAERIAKVIVSSIEKLGGKDDPAVVREDWLHNKSPQFIVELMKNPHNYIIVATLTDGTIAGVGRLRCDGRGVHTCYVDPTKARGGIGTVLLRELEMEAGRCGLEYVDLWSSKYGVTFYRALGYERHHGPDHAGLLEIFPMRKYVPREGKSDTVRLLTSKERKDLHEASLAAEYGSNHLPLVGHHLSKVYLPKLLGDAMKICVSDALFTWMHTDDVNILLSTARSNLIPYLDNLNVIVKPDAIVHGVALDGIRVFAASRFDYGHKKVAVDILRAIGDFESSLLYTLLPQPATAVPTDRTPKINELENFSREFTRFRETWGDIEILNGIQRGKLLRRISREITRVLTAPNVREYKNQK